MSEPGDGGAAPTPEPRSAPAGLAGTKSADKEKKRSARPGGDAAPKRQKKRRRPSGTREPGSSPEESAEPVPGAALTASPARGDAERSLEAVVAHPPHSAPAPEAARIPSTSALHRLNDSEKILESTQNRRKKHTMDQILYGQRLKDEITAGFSKFVTAYIPLSRKPVTQTEAAGLFGDMVKPHQHVGRPTAPAAPAERHEPQEHRTPRALEVDPEYGVAVLNFHDSERY